MIALRRESSINELIRELAITDATETSVGTWHSPDGDMTVNIIHQTGHVYAVPGEEDEMNPALLFRLPVENMGIEAAIQAVEAHLQSAPPQNLRECDMMGCHNPVPEDAGKSVAPGTYLAVCDHCAPIVATVR